MLRPRADTAKEMFRMLPSARARMAVAEVARRVMRAPLLRLTCDDVAVRNLDFAELWITCGSS